MKKSNRRDAIFGEHKNSEGKLDLESVGRAMLGTNGCYQVFVISQWLKAGEFKEEYAIRFRELVKDLFSIAMRANFEPDDNLARLQLKALEKLTQPAKYELSTTDIEAIAAIDKARPSIARAMELRSIMSSLAWVVAPIKDGKCEVNQVIKLKTGQQPKHLEETYRLAEKHWRRGTTLQALAIRVYLAQLQTEGVLDENEKIDEDRLKDDLAEAQRWEASHLDSPHWQMYSLSEEPIRIYEYSQRWKQMRINRNGRKGEGVKKSKKLR